MDNEKKVVITVYGHGEKIDKFSAKMMADCDVDFYCDTINSLILEEGSWACAKAVTESSPYWLEDFRPLTFDLLLNLDDRAIQMLLRQIDSQELAVALRGADTKISDVIFRNMSKRAAAMLKEDMEYMGPQPKEEIAKAREKIIDLISYLEKEGFIVSKKEYV